MRKQFWKRLKNFKTLATLLTLVIFLEFVLSACGHAGIHVDVYGFDITKNRLYYGQKETPSKTQDLEKLDEKNWIAMSLGDWNAVKDYCNKPKP